MKIFVSHSSKDISFARKLSSDLQSLGHSVFLDEWVIQAGTCIPTAISKGLEQAEYLVLILSSSSVASNWVNEEWKAAYWEEVFGGAIRVIPVLVDHCEIPTLLKKRRYVDFTESYEQALSDLENGIASKQEDLFVTRENPDCDLSSLHEELPKLSPAAAQLADCMSDISEKCYCASWFGGLEYTLWHAVINGPISFGTGRVTAEQIEILKSLSRSCRGWVAYRYEHIWIPIEYWKQHFENPKHFPIYDRAFTDPLVEGEPPLVYGFVDDSFRSSWKREALLFDRIVLPHVTRSLDPEPWERKGARKNLTHTKLLLRLIEEQVVVPSSTLAPARPMGEVEEMLTEKYWNMVDSERAGKSPEWHAVHARLTSLQFARKHGVEAYPIYQSIRAFGAGIRRERERLLRVVFGKIPFPDDDVKWDEILEYRRDPESRRRFAALRVWVSRVASRRVPEPEAAEEVEHLLAEFEAHVLRHHISHHLAPFEAVLAADARQMEELLGDKNRRLQKSELQFFRLSTDMFHDAEFSAPGRELAYVSFTRRRFGTGK
jgi:hypothetical protein